jgi:hypothetical protein
MHVIILQKRLKMKQEHKICRGNERALFKAKKEKTI